MLTTKMENSWNIESLYDLRYFNCASCDYKTDIKQDFVNHAYEFHPEESLNYLKNIKDDSMDDISCPWNNMKKLEEIHPNLRGISASVEILPKISKRKQRVDTLCNDENLNSNNYDNITEDPFKNISENKSEVNIAATKGGLISFTCIYCHEPVSRIEIKSHFEKCKMEIGGGKFNEESENLVELYKSKFDYCSKFFLLKKAFKSKDKNGTETIKFKLTCQKCPRIAIGKFITTDSRSPFSNLKTHIVNVHHEVLNKFLELRPGINSSTILKSQPKKNINGEEVVPIASNNIISQIPNYLDKHKYKSVEKKIKCELCDKICTTKIRLKQHMAREHEACICDKCGREFESRRKLKMHDFSTHSRKPWSQKPFSDGPKPCESCGKMFVQDRSLKMHIKRHHAKIFDHQCTTCGKAFCFFHELRIHIQTVHEGIKNFVCPHCGKPFGRSETLRVHRRTVHEGLKDYKCTFCATAYGQSGDLKRHIKRVHSTMGQN